MTKFQCGFTDGSIWHFDIAIDPNSFPDDFYERAKDAVDVEVSRADAGGYLLSFDNGYSCVVEGWLSGCKPSGLIEGDQPTCEVEFSEVTQ